MISGETCFGCSACSNACELGAITMIYGKKGFLVPQVDSAKCIQCDKCSAVCPMNISTENAPYEMKKAYFFIHEDMYDRNLSSSGGFVKALADYVFEHEGICFGAAFDEDLSVHHVGIINRDDVYAILGSKYVQSRTEKTYVEVRKHIERGKLVLYVGTPCQIAGLKAFLGNVDYENLITIDIFCHGVPSEKMWLDYLHEYFSNEEIRYVQFRDKTLGWWQFRFRIQFAHSEYASLYRPPQDDYIRLFLKNITINDICLNCPYRTKKKYSDFYIGDAWNINKVKKNMDDNHGITTVIANSKKAEIIIEEMKKKKHHFFQVSLEDGVYTRTELFNSKSISEEREKFWKYYDKLGMRKTIQELSL